MKDIDVPPHRVVGEKAKLICKFDMEGDILYSVKWYKDDLEFYRFVPNDRPKLQVFPQKGIHVDVSNLNSVIKIINHNITHSDLHIIVLDNNLGVFICYKYITFMVLWIIVVIIYLTYLKKTLTCSLTNIIPLIIIWVV